MRRLPFVLLLLASTQTSVLPAAQARTKPTDMVRVIKAADDALIWQMYDKKFAELKFDQKTLNVIKTVENELAESESNAADRFHLTNVRIVANDVQSLIFRNDLGDTKQVEINRGQITSSCFLTFSGNGFSRCTQ